MAELEHLYEDWDRALAVVAHPDDMEYGAASAVARWSAQGREVSYVLVTDGEAGISDMAPAEVAPLRREEQRRSCEIVGVSELEFLGLPDGLLEEGPPLRRELAAAIRRHRPEVLLSINHRDDWGAPSWNHVDHRVVGRALLDAARDAANPWIFTDLDLAPWDGVRWAAFAGSPEATHGVDIGEHLQTGIDSLAAHAAYLEHLGGDMADPATFLRRAAKQGGHRLGVEFAATFEIVYL
ncbi:MAG: PIG-L deacetylase family protein [Microthrixaceae bacterium]